MLIYQVCLSYKWNNALQNTKNKALSYGKWDVLRKKMREKIRNNIFKIDTDIKNLLTELGEKSLQTLRNAISNG